MKHWGGLDVNISEFTRNLLVLCPAGGNFKNLGQARVRGVLSAVVMLQAILHVILGATGSAGRALCLLSVVLIRRSAHKVT